MGTFTMSNLHALTNASAFRKSEEDLQLKNELDMLVERLKVV